MAITTAEPTIIDGRHARRVTTVGRVFGWFFLATFLTSIPAYFIGYRSILDDPTLITGGGTDPSASVATGATLEVLLIIANVATAVVVYPILKRESEIGAIGYVAARLVEAVFIAVGIVSDSRSSWCCVRARRAPIPPSARASWPSIAERSRWGRGSSRAWRTA